MGTTSMDTAVLDPSSRRMHRRREREARPGATPDQLPTEVLDACPSLAKTWEPSAVRLLTVAAAPSVVANVSPRSPAEVGACPRSADAHRARAPSSASTAAPSPMDVEVPSIAALVPGAGSAGKGGPTAADAVRTHATCRTPTAG